ncbi:MAG: hypothetical protein JWP12_316 [Bacteroidetes bacterium]|nr:hypothetical protein [Bacteroidota bacterium]
MKTCYLINVIGLCFDLIGVLILFKYGLPADVSRDGIQSMNMAGADPDEAKKWKKYNILSRIALLFLICGGVLQIISTWLQSHL